jgi:hypothetical protein
LRRRITALRENGLARLDRTAGVNGGQAGIDQPVPALSSFPRLKA